MSQTQAQDQQLIAAAETAATAAPNREPDIMEQLLKPEIQQSLTTLVESLPKLTEMMAVLTKVYDVAQTVANDHVLIDDLKGGFSEFVKPVQEKVKGLAVAAIEANDRAESESAQTIGLFGILRMLKDPQVQKALRFGQAFLEVMAERKK